MLNTPDWQHISKHIEQVTQQPFTITSTRPVSGGCINAAYILQGESSRYFIKLNQDKLLIMFKAEYAGLKAIAESQTVKVPLPIVYGTVADKSYLIMEMITLVASDRQSQEQLGHNLAALHKTRQAFFGWHQNNTIGSTEQINDTSDNWIAFWRNKRLEFQLLLANKNGYSKHLFQSGMQLADSLDFFFDGYNPQPSLLHGDLWSGNTSTTNKGEPIIFDPACYYGDRETDIAMTELFGGFSSDFYAAYNESFPLHSSYHNRKKLYNLYHILNHLNLFGSGYLHQAQNMIDSLLSEL